MKPREYCCCAIPIVNAGIFSVLVEQLAAGVIAGTLAIATPSSMSLIFSTGASIYWLPCSRRCSDTFIRKMDICYHLLCRGRHTGFWFHGCSTSKHKSDSPIESACVDRSLCTSGEIHSLSSLPHFAHHGYSSSVCRWRSLGYCLCDSPLHSRISLPQDFLP